MQDLRDPIATPRREVKLAGHTISVCDFKPTFWDRVSAGAWEPGAIDAITAHVGPDTLFMDLGAWVGPTTLLAALCGARCIAVEADPQALLELRSNLVANPSLNARVSIIDRAVSPTPGPVTMATRRKPGDSMSSVLLAEQANTGRDAWNVNAITPAELAALAPADRSLFIKLDIEGGEFALLPHLEPLLQRAAEPGARTQALVSFHPGILRETGVAEHEIEARTARALAPFQGWACEAIDSGMQEKLAGSGAPDPQAIATGAQGDCWLFSRMTAANQA